MKKLLAILLAAMMLLSLAACTNNDDNPSGSENNPGTSQSGENNDNQGGESNKQGKEWPTSAITAWSGSGKIVDVSDNSSYTDEYTNYYIVDIESATLDEFTAYLSTLKSAGFTYKSAEEEPAAGYTESDTSYNWNGELADGTRVSATLYKSEKQGVSSSISVYKYVLEIAMWIK